ncbi:hypothetical protein EUGRSUZ_H04413 [Eucalyptus grandis]|uniref:Uncharacterized protein n=2 Tax=Eucalyptus grandis TaxID=71139 RepID=A0ACC3JXE5_EUCGR|nr:hypothetical protein EUGRSUZ_H04413 [Eucalyptus grandis]
MANYGYSYRSQRPYDGFDPWKAERSYYNSEQLCYPPLEECEERMIAVDPYQNPGTYVMKVKTTVERVHPPMFSEFYGQCSPPWYEHRPSRVVVNNKLHGPSIPSNDWPPLVEEFFNEIQNEVSQPSGFGAPRGLCTLRIPISAGSCGTTGNAGDSDHEKERRKLITNTFKDEDLKDERIQRPPVTTEGGYGPRLGHPAGSVLPSHHISSERQRTVQPSSMTMTGHRDRRGPNLELSKPEDDVGMAKEYLKTVADPSCVNTIEDEAPDRSHFRGDKIPKPRVATNGGPAARPGNPTASMLPNHDISSKRGERTSQPPSMTTTGGWERRGPDTGLQPMNETGKTMEYSKEAVKPPSVSTVPKRESIPKTIDSKEAGRRYGNANPSPEPYATGYTSTIDSREAARRYNGQFV